MASERVGPRVKICGVTTVADARRAVELGADFIGLNFYSGSPRYIEPARAAEVVAGLREALGESTPAIIGVFVDEPIDSMRAIAAQVSLDGVQFCGDEPK